MVNVNSCNRRQDTWWTFGSVEDITLGQNCRVEGRAMHRRARQIRRYARSFQSVIQIVVIQTDGAGCTRALRCMSAEILRRADGETCNKAEQQRSYRVLLFVVPHTHSVPVDQVTLPDYPATGMDSIQEMDASDFFQLSRRRVGKVPDM
jgi:hypothetical protein